MAWARSVNSRTESIGASSARVHVGVRVGDGEGGHAKDDLARDPEGLPAGGQDPKVRTPAEQRLSG